jgi:hypothetical protein
MPHDVANTERFRAVMDLCDQIDEFVLNHEHTDDAASRQVLDAIGLVVGTVLHSIWKREHHSVTIDARFGVDGYDATPITVTDRSPTPNSLMASDVLDTPDHPVWHCLDKVHNFVTELHDATDDVDTRRLLDAMLLTIGGIDVAIRENKVTNTLICTEAKNGVVAVTAMPMRME